MSLVSQHERVSSRKASIMIHFAPVSISILLCPTSHERWVAIIRFRHKERLYPVHIQNTLERQYRFDASSLRSLLH
jgi:hypothetical protein